VSVSEGIPNLAAQRAGYIETQLKALKAGTRKNDIMNAIAAQLSPEDMANVAAYFASLPGAGAAAKSDFLPHVAKTSVTFPEGYQSSYVKYHTINFPATKQVRYYYANPAAVQAAKGGQEPPGRVGALRRGVFGEAGRRQEPGQGRRRILRDRQARGLHCDGAQRGLGQGHPDMLRNEDWNYAIFTPDKKHRPGVNQAECFACHKPLDKASYTFTLKELAAAKAGVLRAARAASIGLPFRRGRPFFRPRPWCAASSPR
jgi:hypothetical protein